MPCSVLTSTNGNENIGSWNSFAFIIFAILIENLLRFEDLPLDEGVALKETCVNIDSVQS